MKRTLALLLSFLMVFSLFPSIALAEDTEGTEGTQGTVNTEGTQGTVNTEGTQGTVNTEGTQGTVNTEGTEATAGTDLTVTAGSETLSPVDNVFTISEDVTISGSTTEQRIVVQDDADVEITLDGVSIDLSAFTRDAVGNGESPFTLGSGSKVTLRLANGTTNKLVGGPGYPGLRTVEDSELTIEGSGSLEVTGGELVSSVIQVGGVYGVGSPAAIGSMQDQGFGAINIHSGTITATGKSGTGAGIGGGWGSTGGTITITGGTITASGGPNIGQGAAGIGSGFFGKVDSITISGGTIEANGSNLGAGIGLGGSAADWADHFTILITGGDITATTGIGTAIGSGGYGYGGEITIEGGEITAEATGNGGAGIGGASDCVVNITGGTVTATGGYYGSGIGACRSGNTDGCTVNISGGKVTAQGYTGIGGVENGNGGRVTISGGTVTAISNQTYSCAAIGGGYNGAGGDVIITGGTVKTQGGLRGIGGGSESSSNGTLTNGSEPVYLTEISLQEWNGDAITGRKAVSELEATLAEAAYEYSINDVDTDADGKLYFYLPEGTVVKKLKAAGDTYAGNIVTEADATSGVLRPLSQPVFGTEPLPDAIVGEEYSAFIPCDGTQPITFSLDDGSLPEGLSLNENTGEISGTPTAVGSYTFTIVATNSVGTASQEFSLEVGLEPLQLLEMEYWAAAGVPLDNMKIEVNRDSVTVELLEGDLPPGVTLNPDGSFNGTPTHTGAYMLIVSVSDGIETISEAMIGFVICPNITTETLPNGTVGVPYSFTLTADGNLQDPEWWIEPDTDSTWPEGLNYDEETGEIYGTPQQSGEFVLWARVVDYVTIYGEYQYPLESDWVELTLTIDPSSASTSYTIEAAPNNASYGSVEGAGSYDVNAEVTLKAIPKDGYRFVRWLEGSAPVSTSAVYKFTAAGNRTLTAEFAPIAIPTVNAVSAGYNSIKLTWNAVDGANEYEVYRATSSNGTYSRIAATKALNYTDTGLTPGTTYYYKVRVKCVAGSTTTYGAYSAAASAQPAPLPPASLNASAISYNSIKLTWGSVAGATKYEVYRSTSQNGSYSKIGETSATSYTNKSLATGTTYYYKVRAYRKVGNTKVYSDYSAISSARPVLSAAASLKVRSVSYDYANLTWGAVAGRTKYEIYRSTEQNGTYSKVAETSSTSYKAKGLIPGTTYYYKVRAYRKVSGTKVYGDYSPVLTVTTPAITSPASLNAAPVSYNSVKLTWSAVAGRTKYEVYRSTEQNGTYSKVGETTSTHFTDKKVSPGTTYYYKVRAYRKVSGTKVYGGFSPMASAKPELGTPKASASPSTSSAKLSWSAVSGATKYEVYRAASSSGTYEKIAETSSRSFKDTGLTKDQTYYYKVRAYRLVGSSKVYGPYSSVVSAKAR